LVKIGDRVGAATLIGGDKVFDGTVSTIDYAFAPVRISIPAGTTLTWQNEGAVIHTATATNQAWDTGDIPSGQSRSVSFASPGTFNYNCSPHPWMIGQITVQ
jgi:plastocyanin